MYIEPNGQVKLLHSGLPSDYTDTIWFNNITDQYNYFNGLTGTWINAQSYTRVNRGYSDAHCLCLKHITLTT